MMRKSLAFAGGAALIMGIAGILGVHFSLLRLLNWTLTLLGPLLLLPDAIEWRFHREMLAPPVRNWRVNAWA